MLNTVDAVHKEKIRRKSLKQSEYKKLKKSMPNISDAVPLIRLIISIICSNK